MRLITRGTGVTLASLLLVTGTVLAPAAQADELPEVTAGELEDSASNLALVNRQIQLSTADYQPKNLRNVAGTGNQLRAEAADALEKLLADARQAGHRLTLLSAYRSYERQRVLFNQYQNKYGTEYAERISARPGTSEHQLGLAADLGNASGNCQLHVCFGDTAAGKWVAANAADYGFIIRYPLGLEDVTGYGYEPWHLRYIGTEHAAAMQAAGATTFEAYHELLRERLDGATDTAAQTESPAPNAVESPAPSESASPFGGAAPTSDASDDLVVLRFLPPYRDWSFGLGE